MKKLHYILISLVISFSLSAKEKESETFKLGIATMPQYAITSTMRFDFDITLKAHNVLTLSPMFSFAKNSSLLFPSSSDIFYSEYDTNYPENISLIGGGLKATIRHFFGDFNKNSGVYAGGGLHYRFSHVEYEQDGWIENNPYYTYGSTEKELTVNQVGLDIIFGYQKYLADNIYTDIFAGWGLRISDYKEDNKDEDYWGETILDIGYSGYTPLMGLRLGIFF